MPYMQWRATGNIFRKYLYSIKENFKETQKIFCMIFWGWVHRNTHTHTLLSGYQSCSCSLLLTFTSIRMVEYRSISGTKWDQGIKEASIRVLHTGSILYVSLRFHHPLTNSMLPDTQSQNTLQAFASSQLPDFELWIPVCIFQHSLK